MTELAEGARLEIVCIPTRCTEGSNPSLSAICFEEDDRFTENQHNRLAGSQATEEL